MYVKESFCGGNTRRPAEYPPSPGGDGARHGIPPSGEFLSDRTASFAERQSFEIGPEILAGAA